MAMKYETIKSWPFEDVTQQVDWKDCALYALSIGVGSDPLDADDLRYVYEPGQKCFPTMATVLAYPGFWVRDPATGVDTTAVVHVEQRLQLERPLPAQGTIAGRTEIKALIDKGSGKGALMIGERTLWNARTGEVFGRVTGVSLLRGNGGYSGGDPRKSDEGLPPLQAVPDRPADLSRSFRTPANSALLYRLNGDVNPLHADPAIAHAAGFKEPILHGLCSYGIAAHAVVKACYGGDASRLRRFDARFTAPVFPGETLRTEIWKDGDDFRFRTVVVERDAVALSNGFAGGTA
jgi:acyl dehydratase